MIHECNKPIPCVTPLGDGYIWYITSGGMLENDEYTVILCNGGGVKHFSSDQVKIWNNSTYGIRGQMDVELWRKIQEDLSKK